MRLFLINFLILSSCFGESLRGPVSLSQKDKSKYFELGLSGGTPAGINFCLGYWFGASLSNVVTQVCGMHFGSTLNGFQFNLGQSFYRKKDFRAFWAGSIRNTHAELTGTPVDFFGIGPVIGMNWKFFAIELGLYLGKGTNTKFFPYLKDSQAGSRVAMQVGFQVGIKSLLWQ